MTVETVDQAYARGLADALDLVDTVRAIVPDLLNGVERHPTLAQLADGLTRYDPARLFILRPWDAAEALSVKEAARLADCTPRTVCQWAEKYRIGRLRVGEMRISRPMLLALVEGDAMAIAAMLIGQRQHPSVAPYLVRCGLAIAA